MSLNMDKAIRGATKPKRAAPKKKYLDVLIPATVRDDTLETMFKSLEYRLKEPSWTIVFKSLVVIHILMRRGKNDRVLNHLAKNLSLLNVSGFKNKSSIHGTEQIKNIHTYAMYLEEKVAVYRGVKIDFTKVSSGENRLRKLTVAKGLLREVKVLQRQLETLLNCKFYMDEIDNEITLCAFSLLVKDLLTLFQAMNEGVISVLDQYFEMSKIDAKDSLQIYKTFVKQTEGVVDYLGAAKNVRGLGVNIPNLRHAPTSLTVALEDYINDPDFEINRQQFKRAKEDRAKAQKAPSASTKSVDKKPSGSKPKNDSIVTSTAPLSTSGDKIQKKENNFIDFFASIEQEHTVIIGNQYYQNTGTDTLGTNSLHYGTATNPFLAMQNQENQKVQPISTIQNSNPFRQTLYVQDPAPISQAVVPYQNPFHQSSPSSALNPFDSLTSMNSEAQFQSQLSQQTIQPSTNSMATDNNPFRRLSTYPSQQTQLTVFSQSMHSQDSSTSSFQSTFSQNQFPSYLRSMHSQDSSTSSFQSTSSTFSQNTFKHI